MQFKAKVTNGKMTLNNRDIFTNEIQKYEGKDLILEIREAKSQRSLNQNAYYWGIVLDILSKETGYTLHEMHEVLKSKFLSTIIDFFYKNKTEVLYGSRSTANLNTKEFENYLEEIRRWAITDLSINIPEPNENYDYLLTE